LPPQERLFPAAFAAYGAAATAECGTIVLEAPLTFRMCATACLFAGAFALSAAAQQPATPPPPAPMLPYGPIITLDQAKRVMAAAELEAAKNAWQVAITILDSGGNLVMFHKLDNAQLSAGGPGWRLLALKDITPLEGGVLIVVDGKIVGAIGVSGALSAQDAQVASTGAAALSH
jgi:uncharacterized protein GlcG (DUF336 family)